MNSMLLLAIALFAALPQQSGATATIQADFRIYGQVVNSETGQPIPQAKMEITLARTEGGDRTVFAGNEGNFQFDHVAPGKYMLTAEHRGFVRQAFMQHDGYATSIVVGQGLDSGNLVFRLVPDSSISGQIADEGNDPVRNAQVILFSQGTNAGKLGIRQQNGTSTDDEGHFRLPHLEPGTYYLAVSAQPWYAQYVQHGPSRNGQDTSPDPSLDLAYPLTFYPDTTDDSGAEAIILKAGDHAEADVHLLAVPAVHMRVTSASASPSRDGPNLNTSVSKRVFGQIALDVPVAFSSFNGREMEIGGFAPGRYALRASTREGEQFSTQTRELNAADGGEIDIEKESGGSLISGTVKFEGIAAPANFGKVLIRNVETEEVQMARISPNGKFEVQHHSFGAGRYEVTVNSDSNFVTRLVSASGGKIAGNYVELNGSENVSITLIASPAISGVDGVALRDGKPVSGVMIVLVPPDPVNSLSSFRRDQTNTDGSFSLDGVVPGKYTVIAVENGWNLEWADPAVLAKYLPGGVKVDAETEGKYNLRVTVQQP